MPGKASFHRTRWNVSLQGRTAWESSLHLEDWQFQAESSAARCLWRAGFHPGPCPGAAATHRTPCAAATPHGAFDFAKRLECPACWRFRRATPRPETYRPAPIFQARSTPDPIRWSADDIYPQRAGFQAGPGRVHPNRRPRPEDSKAPPAELLPPQAPREPVTGREPKPSPESAASLKRAGFPC
jgi:hypothetical protein